MKSGKRCGKRAGRSGWARHKFYDTASANEAQASERAKHEHVITTCEGKRETDGSASLRARFGSSATIIDILDIARMGDMATKRVTG